MMEDARYDCERSKQAKIETTWGAMELLHRLMSHLAQYSTKSHKVFFHFPDRLSWNVFVFFLSFARKEGIIRTCSLFRFSSTGKFFVCLFLEDKKTVEISPKA